MFKNIVSTLFRISVLGFLLGGLTVVVLQAAGLILGDGGFVTSVSDVIAPWAYGAAGVAGLLAFAMSYFPGDQADDSEVSANAAHVPEHA